MLAPGEKVGSYVLRERLGAGGFGEVWRAEHEVLRGRTVAIKLATAPGAARALKREGAIQAQLEHPGIVKVIDVCLGEPPHIVYEYVRGKNLRQGLRERGGKLPEDEAREALLEVAEALAHAHGRGVVHGDLKPENILVDAGSGRRKLTDFGLAHAARVEGGVALSQSLESTAFGGDAGASAGKARGGSMGYVAPEALEGRPIDPRADVYALGVLLFELVTGRLPQGRDLPSVVGKGIEPWWDELFMLCYTAYERRLANAEVFGATLSGIAAGAAEAAAGGGAGREVEVELEPEPVLVEPLPLDEPLVRAESHRKASSGGLFGLLVIFGLAAAGMFVAFRGGEGPRVRPVSEVKAYPGAKASSGSIEGKGPKPAPAVPDQERERELVLKRLRQLRESGWSWQRAREELWRSIAEQLGRSTRLEHEYVFDHRPWVLTAWPHSGEGESSVIDEHGCREVAPPPPPPPLGPWPGSGGEVRGVSRPLDGWKGGK